MDILNELAKEIEKHNASLEESLYFETIEDFYKYTDQAN